MNNPKEKDEKLQYKISLIILVFALVFVCFFATYAFFIVPDSGKNEEVTVSSGNLSLVFADGNPGFSKQLEFGSSAEKTFTIHNDGALDVAAKINWKNLTNTYQNGSLTYTLSYSETETGTYIDIVTNKNVPRSEAPTTLSLANGLEIPAGKTYFYKLAINLNYTDFNQTEDLKASLNTEFSIEEGQVSQNLVQALLAKTNDVSVTDYNSGVKEEMFTFTHPEAEQTTGWSEEERIDYRYIGASPNNYIQFNDETWRIIGVFTVENEVGVKEQRVKIIRGASIGSFSWDKKSDGTYANEWPTSSLATMLNGDYIEKEGTFEYVNYGYWGTKTSTLKALNSISKNQISLTKWYLGGAREESGLTKQDYYNFERGSATCSTNGSCPTETRSTNMLAKVGLIYPSDCLFMGGNDSSSWLSSLSYEYMWAITPLYTSVDSALKIGKSYIEIDTVSTDEAWNTPSTPHFNSIFPCVYLRSDIKTIGGTGTEDNMYQLES